MATELRPDIQSAKDRISTRMGAGREFKKLESYLWEGEVVDSVCVGQYGRGTGLLVLTNSRLLFLVDGMTGSTFEDFPLSKITSVQWSSGFVQGTLTVYASGNKAEINNVAKPDGPPLADKVRAILAGHTAPVASAPPAFAAAPPPPLRLRRRFPRAGIPTPRTPPFSGTGTVSGGRSTPPHSPSLRSASAWRTGVCVPRTLPATRVAAPHAPVRPSHTAPDGHSHRERPRGHCWRVPSPATNRQSDCR